MSAQNLKKEDVEFTTDLKKKISEFIGKKVTAYVGGKVKNNFDTAISVSGLLHEHPDYKGMFRIVNIHDAGTYTYFSQANIVRIVTHPTHTFENGSVAVIQIDVKSEWI